MLNYQRVLELDIYDVAEHVVRTPRKVVEKTGATRTFGYHLNNLSCVCIGAILGNYIVMRRIFEFLCMVSWSWPEACIIVHAFCQFDSILFFLLPPVLQVVSGFMVTSVGTMMALQAVGQQSATGEAFACDANFLVTCYAKRGRTTRVATTTLRFYGKTLMFHRFWLNSLAEPAPFPEGWSGKQRSDGALALQAEKNDREEEWWNMQLPEPNPTRSNCDWDISIPERCWFPGFECRVSHTISSHFTSRWSRAKTVDFLQPCSESSGQENLHIYDR